MNGNDSAATYASRLPWNDERPRILVIACSDGRLQENVDDFLQNHLGITRYDRLYTPGGPGALAMSGVEFLRAEQFRRECEFLVAAHRVEEVFLIFHGPAEGGPDAASCADYRRKFPRQSSEELRDQQERDAAELLRRGFGWHDPVRVHIWRCEVTAGEGVQFVNLGTRT